MNDPIVTQSQADTELQLARAQNERLRKHIEALESKIERISSGHAHCCGCHCTGGNVDNRPTDPAPPPAILASLPPCTEEDTGPISQHDRTKADAVIALMDVAEQMGEARRAMDLAQYKTDVALGLSADAEAKRTPTRMERIEADVAEVRSDTKRILETLENIANNLLGESKRITDLETWRRTHERHGHEEQLAPVKVM